MGVFWRVFFRILRLKAAAVGIVFAGIAAISAMMWAGEMGWRPATGTVLTAERAGAGYDATVRVTQGERVTVVPMDLYATRLGPRRPGDTLELVQSPGDPTKVSLRAAAESRPTATLGFGFGALALLWLALGARLPRRKPADAASARVAPVTDSSRARTRQPVGADGRRSFGRR
jgi:hypothetical protein